MNIRTTISPMECRLISELLAHPEGGASPTALANASLFERATIYALLGRMRVRGLVRAERVGATRSLVRYRVTAKGVKARERFAREVGLTP